MRSASRTFGVSIVVVALASGATVLSASQPGRASTRRVAAIDFGEKLLGD